MLRWQDKVSVLIASDSKLAVGLITTFMSFSPREKSRYPVSAQYDSNILSNSNKAAMYQVTGFDSLCLRIQWTYRVNDKPDSVSKIWQFATNSNHIMHVN